MRTLATRISGIVLVLTLGIACGEPAPPSAAAGAGAEAVPPIRGAQLDAMQASLRAAGLKPAVWASVERSPDETRAVVHARVDGLEESTRVAFCTAALEAMERELEAGQQLELYLVDPDDGVHACRAVR